MFRERLRGGGVGMNTNLTNFSLYPDLTDAQKFVSSKGALAEKLGVSRQTVDAWKSFPGAPRPRENGLYNVDEWRFFAEKNGLGRGNLTAETIEEFSLDAIEPTLAQKIQAARLRKIELEIEKAEKELAIIERTHRPVEEFARAWKTAAEILRAILSEKLGEEAEKVFEVFLSRLPNFDKSQGEKSK